MTHGRETSNPSSRHTEVNLGSACLSRAKGFPRFANRTLTLWRNGLMRHRRISFPPKCRDLRNDCSNLGLITLPPQPLPQVGFRSVLLCLGQRCLHFPSLLGHF